MRATVYITKPEIRKYLERKGYQFRSIRKILTAEFGYTSGKQFSSLFPSLSKHVLNINVAWKNHDEYRDIVMCVSRIITFLKNDIEESKLSPVRHLFGIDIIFLTKGNENLYYHHENKSGMLYYYTEPVVFKRNFIEDTHEKLELYGFSMSI